MSAKFIWKSPAEFEENLVEHKMNLEIISSSVGSAVIPPKTSHAIWSGGQEFVKKLLKRFDRSSFWSKNFELVPSEIVTRPPPSKTPAAKVTLRNPMYIMANDVEIVQETYRFSLLLRLEQN